MFCFSGGSTGNAHALLDNMDRRNHISIGTDVILNAGNGLGICEQPLHFGFGAAIAQLEVIQHRVVLLGKTLVCVLDETDVGAHLIGVIRHIGDGHIRILDSRFRIAAQGGNQRCGEGCDRRHIIVCRHTSGLVCVIGVLLQSGGGVFEQGIDTAYQLLVFAIGFHNSFAQGNCGSGSGGHTGAHCHAYRF